MIKSVRRFDLGQITSVEETPQGFLKVPGFATRTGVFTYLDAQGGVRRELRHPDDVFDPISLATLKNAPVTLDHPPVMVDPSNVKQYIKGYTTDRVEVNRDLVETDLIIAEQDAIRAIKVMGFRELSSGYLADLDEESGEFMGAQYDCRQRNIKYNHVAIVKHGRAGPEARLRMDSADAIMRTDANPNEPANQFNPEGENDSDDLFQNTKPVVISGQSIDLPTHLAEVIQDMLDRYDQMRGEVAKLREGAMAKRSDVDINQKGISPQVDVVQMAPDGRGASKKINEGDRGGPGRAAGMLDEEEKGIIGGVKSNTRAGGAAELKDDEDEKEEKKDKRKDKDEDEDEREDDDDEEMMDKKRKDYEGTGGDGIGMSPTDRLKKDIEELEKKKDSMEKKLDSMRAKADAMEAKADEYANKSFEKGEKMDKADFQASVRRRVALERTAEKLVPSTISKRFDSMTSHEIRMAVIKHKHPNADLTYKSKDYIRSRFDTISEELEEGISNRKAIGSALLETERMDTAAMDPYQARLKAIHEDRNRWKQPLATSKRK